MVKTSAELLNGRLTHFISNNLGWTELNPIQEKAIPTILDGKDSLVIAPTASGKTEAVLLPVFSEIISKGLDPTSVIYVAPLKALINDMHNRIEKWGNHFHLTATKWHGDVESNVKNQYIKNPTDFLSITPESLEVILMNKSLKNKIRIFQNVKYIIIDEIHYFADSDRGTQLNSIINRISKYTKNDIQKIGLSATVGNPEVIAEWIDHKNPAEIIKDESGRVFQYKVRSLFGEELVSYLKKYHDKKILVFCRSRKDTEIFYSLFRENLNIKNIFIHHSSLSKEDREESERKFKELDYGFMFSTSTLELGIDIGDIDIVVLIGAPYNIGSFLQRVGRSGRRSKRQRAIIIASRFDLLIALADLILVKEDEIEKIIISKESKDLMFHQLLSCIFNEGRINYKEAYKYLVNCYAFSEISKRDYMQLLKKMDELDFIDIDKQGFLTLGYGFEKTFGNWNFMNFYSVFCPSFEYKIKEGHKEVGTLDVAYASMLEVGSQFILGGKPWKVNYKDDEEFYIKVDHEPSPDADAPSWFSEGPPLNYMITRKVYDILLNDFDRTFLKRFDSKSTEAIENAISVAKQSGFEKNVVPVYINKANNQVKIYTFAGDKANNLLAKIIHMYHDIYSEYTTAYYTSFRVPKGIEMKDIEYIFYNMEEILEKDETIELIDQLVGKFYKNKFINYLPRDDEIKLKMHLLFDKEGLLDLVKNNDLIEIPKDKFKKVFLDQEKEDNKEEV